jgi:hypothetical protein
MSQEKLIREVKILRIFNAVLLAIVLSVMTMAFREDNRKKRFDQIDVQLLNVVTKDGKLILAIGDKGRLPYAMNNGKVLNRQERGPGMIMFNRLGDECGGFLWDAYEDGSAGHILTMDQYKQDQIVSLIYNETAGPFGDAKKKRMAGLSVNPQPTTAQSDELVELYTEARKIPDSAKRVARLNDLNKKYYTKNSMFVGTRRNEDIGLFVSDGNLNPRLKIYVDSKGNPKLEFMDSTGKTIFSIPR